MEQVGGCGSHADDQRPHAYARAVTPWLHELPPYVADQPLVVAIAAWSSTIVVLADTAEGRREILGLWAGDGGEGAKHWLRILTEIKNRGVNDVLMLVCDGLKGLPGARRG